MTRRMQRIEGASRGDIGAGETRRDRVAVAQRRPAAALLERGEIRLRRREGVGFVLEAADRNDRHGVCKLLRDDAPRQRSTTLNWNWLVADL